MKLSELVWISIKEFILNGIEIKDLEDEKLAFDIIYELDDHFYENSFDKFYDLVRHKKWISEKLIPIYPENKYWLLADQIFKRFISYVDTHERIFHQSKESIPKSS